MNKVFKFGMIVLTLIALVVVTAIVTSEMTRSSMYRMVEAEKKKSIELKKDVEKLERLKAQKRPTVEPAKVTYKPVTTPSPARDLFEETQQFIETADKAVETTEKAVEVYRKVRPAPEPSKAKSMEVDIIIKEVYLANMKANGKVWDNSGDPDPQITISKGYGCSYTTDVKRDTFYALFNEKSIRVREGDTITLTVYDDDFSAPDEAGSFTKIITAETMKLGTVIWTFGQVSTLVLEFQP